MTTHSQTRDRLNPSTKRTFLWLLPFLLGGLCFLVIVVPRVVKSSNTGSSPQRENALPCPAPAANVTPIIGDWNRDGRDEVGIYYAIGGNGRFVVDYNASGSADAGDPSTLYGSSGLRPVVGDWNGDGRDQIGICQDSGGNAQFILDANDSGVWETEDRTFVYGLPSDAPIVGDWDGDGRDQVGNFRAIGSDGQFILDSNDSGMWEPEDRVILYGFATDTPIIGDWNGDGRDEIGVHRAYGADGQFILDWNGTGSWEKDDPAYLYGTAQDMPIIGDWNGDGRDQIGIFRADAAGGQFILDSNGNGSLDAEDRVIVYSAGADKMFVGGQGSPSQ